MELKEVLSSSIFLYFSALSTLKPQWRKHSTEILGLFGFHYVTDKSYRLLKREHVRWIFPSFISQNLLVTITNRCLMVFWCNLHLWYLQAEEKKQSSKGKQLSCDGYLYYSPDHSLFEVDFFLNPLIGKVSFLYLLCLSQYLIWICYFTLSKCQQECNLCVTSPMFDLYTFFVFYQHLNSYNSCLIPVTFTLKQTNKQNNNKTKQK